MIDETEKRILDRIDANREQIIAFAEDIAKAQTAGMDDHIPKPIDFSRLLGVLQRYAGREQN